MTNLFKHLKNIRLTENERTKMRSNLLNYLEKNPVRTPDMERHNWHQRSSIFSLFLTKKGKLYMPALIIALMITVSGGLSAAANGSLPGDLLHPIKVNVNERMRAVLATNNEAKADLALKLMNERLEETELLAAKTDLKTEIVVQIEARFDAQADKLRGLIEKFQTEGKTEIAAKLSANLNALLEVHDRVLAQLQEKLKDVDSTNVGKIRAKVRAEIKNAQDINVKVETQVKTDDKTSTSTKPTIQRPEAEQAAKAKLEAVQHKIDEVAKFIAAKTDSSSAESVAQAEAKLNGARELVAQGRVKLEAKAYGEAFALFQKAHITAQSAKLELTLEHRLRIEIKHEENKTEAQSKREEPRTDESKIKPDEEKSDNENRGQGLEMKLDHESGMKLEVR